jgi:hypothetical protein
MHAGAAEAMGRLPGGQDDDEATDGVNLAVKSKLRSLSWQLALVAQSVRAALS